jgi:UDP-N-acetylmuramoyl-tripeptide--D-alanyl-D-alanine ligase
VLGAFFVIAQTLSDLAQTTGGRLVGASMPFASVSTDSRSLSSGALFVALKGPNFDGHEYATTALQRGAVGALVERELPLAIPQVVVGDALQALSTFARTWRREFDIPVIGITGSNGKTTTKEMIGAILAQSSSQSRPQLSPCLVTQGNLNNHIGVPLTLMNLNAEHHSAVIEMGANHQGEIAALSAIAKPTIGIVTNAGAAHLEGFGGLDGVARGKGELFVSLPASGTAIVNADDDFADYWRETAKSQRVLTFGLSQAADFWARGVQTQMSTAGFGFEFELMTPNGSQPCMLALAGMHNLRNALGAAAVAYAAGGTLSDIASGLAVMRAVGGRLNLLPAICGAFLLDDSYNANPSSLRAGIDALQGLPGDHWLVLGDMLELGAGGDELHAEMGAYARAAGVSRMFAVGPRASFAAESFGVGAEWFSSVDALIARVQNVLQPNVTVLIKGSRGNRLERVTAAISVAPAVSGH